MKKIIISVFIAVAVIFFGGTFTIENCMAEVVPFNSDRWEIIAKQSNFEEYLGKKSLYLKAGGFAVVKDSEFTNGIIEFDVAIPDKRGFIGALWRVQDRGNYEKFYMRPHQSGNPDANQYTPVFNASQAWQLYYGDGYGIPFRYSFDKWFHVKIVVSGIKAEIYIEDMDIPVLMINELKRKVQSGKVGVWVFDQIKGLAGGHFANFSYVQMDNPTLKGEFKSPDKIQPGTIMSWQVSNAFNGKKLLSKLNSISNLPEKFKQKLSWKKLESEKTGIANLARIQGNTKENNTVFAKVIVISEKDQIKPIKFGFSDEVRVYLNNQLLYYGNNTYRTRDYRYLGTIGLFNELYLPLKKGINEICMAVSEKFGGWGIQARFMDMDGVVFKTK